MIDGFIVWEGHSRVEFSQLQIDYGLMGPTSTVVNTNIYFQSVQHGIYHPLRKAQ